MEQQHKTVEDMVAVGGVRKLDAMLALTVAVSRQGLGLWGHSSLVTTVCGDFHTLISKLEDKLMCYEQSYLTLQMSLFAAWLQVL